MHLLCPAGAAFMRLKAPLSWIGSVSKAHCTGHGCQHLFQLRAAIGKIASTGTHDCVGAAMNRDSQSISRRLKEHSGDPAQRGRGEASIRQNGTILEMLRLTSVRQMGIRVGARGTQ